MTDAYVSRAVAYVQKSNTAAALADLNTAIGGKPDLQRAYWHRGTIYLNAGDNGKAIADLMAIQLDPKDAKALYARGLAKRKNGDATGSDADMAAAKALDPDVEKRM
jgi:Tfp pilus assembly protein PilF